MPIPVSDQTKQKLTDEDIIALAKIAISIENLYQFPQDIEWAKEKGKLYIVQTRPITTITAQKEPEEEVDGIELLSGLPASPGMATGLATIVLNPSEIGRVKKGDVLIAEMTTPDFVPAMKRAVAIATDRGGRTCHAAIVSRELGVPCVVGTGNATKVLKDKAINYRRWFERESLRRQSNKKRENRNSRCAKGANKDPHQALCQSSKSRFS